MKLQGGADKLSLHGEYFPDASSHSLCVFCVEASSSPACIMCTPFLQSRKSTLHVNKNGVFLSLGEVENHVNNHRPLAHESPCQFKDISL